MKWWCHKTGSALVKPGNTNPFVSHHLNSEFLGNGFTPYSLLFQDVVLFPLNLIYFTYFTCWLWHFIPALTNHSIKKDIRLSCSGAEWQRTHSQSSSPGEYTPACKLGQKHLTKNLRHHGQGCPCLISPGRKKTRLKCYQYLIYYSVWLFYVEEKSIKGKRIFCNLTTQTVRLHAAEGSSAFCHLKVFLKFYTFFTQKSNTKYMCIKVTVRFLSWANEVCFSNLNYRKLLLI